MVDFISIKRSSIQINNERESWKGVAVIDGVMIAHKNGAADLDINYINQCAANLLGQMGSCYNDLVKLETNSIAVKS